MSAELLIETTYAYSGWCEECSAKTRFPRPFTMEAYEEFRRLYSEFLKDIADETENRDEAEARIAAHNAKYHPAPELVGGGE